jgi:hypothetical protein
VPRGSLVLLVLLAAAGCSAPAAAPPVTVPDQHAALVALASSEPAALDPEHLTHDVGGHDVWGPVAEPDLDEATQATLDEQWAAATAAAQSLLTTDEAEAAGYRRSADEIPGIGAHYIRWDLVDQPFDPAHPSMLLYDESNVRPDRLVGFSYWVRSVDTPPAGFAGDGDHWHMHHGLCFVSGFLFDEGVSDPSGCDGVWLAGSDLWMMHAWVVEEPANPYGRFAPRNPNVCPGRVEPVADFNRCPDPIPRTAADAAALSANELVCLLPGATTAPPTYAPAG